MHLETLRLFRDVCDLRSFSRAAEAHRISQSAASQAIQALEEQMGARLLDRTKRPPLLTPEGRIYLEAVRPLLAGIDRAEARIREVRAEVHGTVRVAAIYSIGFSEMGRQIRAFTAGHPRARVHLEYLRPDKIVQAVEEGTADLGILSFPRPRRALAVVPLREEEMVLACRTRDRWARLRRRLRPADLDGIPFVAFDHDLPIRRAVDRALRAAGARPSVVAEFDNIMTIRAAILDGAGVSILPRPSLRVGMEAGRLAAVRLPFDLRRPVGVIHRKGAALSAAAAAFLAVLTSDR